MTNDPIYNRLRELSWRRKLTADEAAELRAWLATHPEAQADWEAEAGLNEALGRLPDVPVPSNFTARVLQASSRKRAAELRRQRGKWQVWLRWRWLPKVAVAAVVLVAGLVSYQQVAKVARRAEYGAERGRRRRRVLTARPRSPEGLRRHSRYPIQARQRTSNCSPCCNELEWAHRSLAWRLLVATGAFARCRGCAAETSAGVHLQARPHTASSIQPPAVLPPIPPTKSPVAFFRELLAMNARRAKAGADESFAGKPEADPGQSARILGDESRPARGAPASHGTALVSAAADDGPGDQSRRATGFDSPAEPQLVEDRLREWDKLPPDVQKELLGNEATLRYFAEIEGRTDEQRRKILESMSPARRQSCRKGIEQWRRDVRRPAPEDDEPLQPVLRADHRRKRRRRSRRSPGRSGGRSRRRCRPLASLPPDQRAQCIRSFEKFASLSLEERQQFLKNAERWKLMTPSERQAWRDLVAKLPPPLPPDFPPLPPSPRSPRPTPAVATNGG